MCKKKSALRGCFMSDPRPAGARPMRKNGQLVSTSVLQDRARNLTTALPLFWQFPAKRAFVPSASTSVVGACTLPASSAAQARFSRVRQGGPRGPGGAFPRASPVPGMARVLRFTA